MGVCMDDKLERAIAAIDAGDRKLAANLLLALLQIDSDNQDAWLWLESISDSSEKRRLCLKEVLRINPNNREARRGLISLQATVSEPKARHSATDITNSNSSESETE